MNIETVNEIIASLESAGELSIKERKYLELAKAYVQLAAENVGLKAAFSPEEIPAEAVDAFMDTAVMDHDWNDTSEWSWVENETEVIRAVLDALKPETPATDRIVAGIKADVRVEGAHFVANRMLAAWDAGFIEDTAKNAADIARMILTSTEFMADAPEGDFDRSFADGILEDIAKHLREVSK
ncbi:TPA: ead/Ea22-like family protein [Raoultella ornithinolytica]|uniref:ead/Ea22-like family protein n=1 Tax=Raoultella ornithinolytica TaxID=54291 RepID=UPI002DBF4651|nr:ead/Ea22-like family protein [Raoultella ornithinolytica]MEB7958876.1 ead/Ea22-like family protein [Raoultella ornithinolytica]